MSLINQMLKELDARRVDAAGGSPFGEQVRAVPDRRRIHPAWWLVAALAAALTAVLVWVLLRPPAPDPYMVRAQLPLRLEVDIDSLQATADAGAVAESAPVVPAASLPPAPAEWQAERPREEPVQVQLQPELLAPAAPSREVDAPKRASAAKEVAKPAPAALASLQPERKLPAPVAAPKDEPPTHNPIAKQVRELTPAERAENEFRKATLAVQQGRRGDAQAGFEQALQIDARHAAARQALIAVLLDARRDGEALRRAREGLDLDPRQIGFAMILARLQLEKKELGSAIETLERSRPHAADRADYLAFLAALLQRDGRHKEAVEQYVLALQKAPDNGLWWMGMGISLQAEQRKPEALEAFQRARASRNLSPDLLAFVDGRMAQLK